MTDSEQGLIRDYPEFVGCNHTWSTTFNKKD